MTALPSPTDCCQQFACSSVVISLVQTNINGIPDVDNLAALRALPATVRVPNVEVGVLGEVTPFDGAGWKAVWRPSDLTPDAPPNSTRPNDVPTDLDAGRWRQFI